MSNVVSLEGYIRAKEEPRTSPGPDRMVTRHNISRIMFEPQFVEADAQGRVLAANIQYGSVFLYIEGLIEPKEKVRLKFEGYRSFGDRIPPGAQYVASVFEHGDHAHIYLVAGSRIEG